MNGKVEGNRPVVSPQTVPSAENQHIKMIDRVPSLCDLPSGEDPASDCGSKEPQPRGGVVTPFPWKLHDMLESVEEDGYAHIVSWQPHGRCFAVHKPKDFVELVKIYFNQTKLASFQRQLNLCKSCCIVAVSFLVMRRHLASLLTQCYLSHSCQQTAFIASLPVATREPTITRVSSAASVTCAPTCLVKRSREPRCVAPWLLPSSLNSTPCPLCPPRMERPRCTCRQPPRLVVSCALSLSRTVPQLPTKFASLKANPFTSLTRAWYWNHPSAMLLLSVEKTRSFRRG